MQQTQFWTDTNWTLIISIIVGSAALAYAGDILGYKYGKQRISIFGLRPRHTSHLITACTGMFISVVVLAILSFFSESVRAALFKMQTIQQDLHRVTVQLQNNQRTLFNAQNELADSRERLSEQQYLLQTTALSLDITRFDMETLRQDRDILLNEKNDLEAMTSFLRGEAEELRRDLEVTRMGAITVQANSMLAQQVINPGTPRETVDEIITALEAGARVEVATKRSERLYTVSADIVLAVDSKERAEVAARASDSQERLYVRALATENTALNETVTVRLESGISYLLYNEGETVFRKLINSGESGFNAEESLHVFLRELKNQAITNGVRPDPATYSVGSLEGEDFFDIVETLKSMGTFVIINALASEDIYTEGPVRIKILLE